MGIVSTFTFTSATETVTDTKLNNLVALLLNEFNGSIENANIAADAAIANSKLNLTTIAQAVTFSAAVTCNGAVTLGDATADDITINGSIAATINLKAEDVDIGTTSIGLNDLHFGSGGIINFDGGDVTITHSAAKLTFGGDGAVELDFNNHEMTNVDINSGAIDGVVLAGADEHGEIYYADASFKPTPLANGTAGQVLTSGGAAAPTWSNYPQHQEYTSGSGTWTSPAGVTRIWVTGVAGGGAGGHGGGGASSEGGGGGQSVVKWPLTVVASTGYAYAVGAGGAGVASGDGTNGGDTTLVHAGGTLTLDHGDGGAGSGGSGEGLGGGDAMATNDGLWKWDASDTANIAGPFGFVGGQGFDGDGSFGSGVGGGTPFGAGGTAGGGAGSGYGAGGGAVNSGTSGAGAGGYLLIEW